MKDIFDISKLIIKKKLKTLDSKEASRLKQFNKDYPFSKDVDFDAVIQKIDNYSTIDKDKAWNRVLGKTGQNKGTVFLPFKNQTWFKYAAMIIVFLGIGYLYNTGVFTSEQDLVIPDVDVTLQLDDGKVKIIKEGYPLEVVDTKGEVLISQKGNQLVYNKESVKETLVYNTLNVPYGKRFEVQLSDGTNVYLNAGSSLKYPVKFLKGENRQVFLEGEAYFSVTKDESHPFIVNAHEIDVRVLGTEFNISSYREDENIKTILVEGLVSVYKSGGDYNVEESTLLEPNYKAAFNKKDKQLTVEAVNIESHTAWMDGRLILNEVAFQNILKKLERQYNVVFINNNKAIENRRFTARFDTEDIYQVMRSLSASASFEYSFNKNQITIN